MNPPRTPDNKLWLFISAALLLGCGGVVGLAILITALLAPPAPAPPIQPPNSLSSTPLPATITPLLALAPTFTALPPSTPATPTLPPAADCPNSAKIAFDKTTGCQNDGSFEFCIPAYDANAMQAMLAIAPGASCGPGRGRAQCGEDQLLCLVPTIGLCNLSARPAMNDYGWQVTCQLAELPFIAAIVPTWYE